MAQPYTNNWACKAISDLLLGENTDAEEVAKTLSTQPEFLAVIQEVIDYRDEPGYDPKRPGGDPATQLVRMLSEKLVEPAN